MDVRDASEIERAVAAFANGPNGGLIVTGSPLAAVHRDLIISLASRHKLPTVYFVRYFIPKGGLISYGPDFVDQYRRAAEYVDRIPDLQLGANVLILLGLKTTKFTAKYLIV